MNLTLGFSPCPNDTYMFAALVNQWIDTDDVTFIPFLDDVETLNVKASKNVLDITKMSFHRALYLDDHYKLLSSGAALGNGCGPILIGKTIVSDDLINQGPIALPGAWTTAHLLFKYFYPRSTNKVFHVFSEIESLVSKEKVVAGVIIHENRFTYESRGLVKIMDLGEAWEAKTGLPIPLGGIFASTRLAPEMAVKVEKYIRESILFAHQHPDIVIPYVRQFAQEMDDSVMWSHIRLYVNEFSLDLGAKGQKSIAFLKEVLF